MEKLHKRMWNRAWCCGIQKPNYKTCACRWPWTISASTYILYQPSGSRNTIANCKRVYGAFGYISNIKNIHSYNRWSIWNEQTKVTWIWKLQKTTMGSRINLSGRNRNGSYPSFVVYSRKNFFKNLCYLFHFLVLIHMKE